LKAINVGGFDVMDRPLPFGRKEQSLNDVEVVLTDRVNELRGTIADDRTRPAPGANVIIFSTDRDRWYPSSRFLRTAITGADGAFTIAGLPFGSYYAAAVTQRPVEGEDAWQSSEFLTSLVPRAFTVTVGMGQNPSLSLRLPGR
jgi:predicted cobalt transporter CbtA